ncbi:excisionase family DNA-binding protein [Kitasatospora hibisci]|uniref:excisionase family DNA-binding protein n=1 Tax=Kitasatospora hibisci TaxID=3369522 RepID=UPI0037551770
MPEQYLTVAQVAERLGTSERFPRRLIAERRIAFVKIGTHVRIAESVLTAYIEASTVPAIRSTRSGRSRFGRAV